MKSNNKLIILLWVFLILIRCEYERGYDPVSSSPSGTARPEITAIEPDSAKNGILEITLKGKNFSPVSGDNFILFGTTLVHHIITANDDQLTFLRPLDISGAVTVRVSVKRASQISPDYDNYWLEEGIFEMIGSTKIYSFAIDSAENLYVHNSADDIVYKLSPDGEQSEYGNVIDGSTNFESSTMRMGPGGYLYVQRNTSDDGGYKRLYTIAPGGAETERFVKLSRAVRSFDFDQNGNIFSGGTNSGMFIIHPDKSFARVGNYQDFDIRAVRVFDGYVYVAAKYTGTETLFSPDTATVIAEPNDTGIWKNQILNDELNASEIVFNWADAGSFSQSEIKDITFSEEGDIYVSTDNSEPVLVIHSIGTIEALYENLLTGPTNQLVWGNGNYLYVNRYNTDEENSGVDRIIMGKKGAPYFGR